MTYNVNVIRPGNKYSINYTISAVDMVELVIKIRNMGCELVRVDSAT